MLSGYEEDKQLPSRVYGEGIRQKLLKQDAEVSRLISGAGVIQRWWCYANDYLGYAYSGRFIHTDLIRGELIGNGGNANAGICIAITSLPHAVGEYWGAGIPTLPDYLVYLPVTTNALVWTVAVNTGVEAVTALVANVPIYINLWFGGTKGVLGVLDFTVRGRNLKGTMKVIAAFDP